MRRLFRLWFFYGGLDIKWMLRDIGSFAIYAFSDVVNVVAAITAMLLISERFDGVGPWSQTQITFLLGYAVMVNGALDTVFGYNIAFISRRIGRGQLDHILVQPQPMWVTLVTEGFSPCAGLPIFLPGLGLLGWATVQLGIQVTLVWLTFLLFNFLGSCLIVFAVSYVVGSLAFWAPRASEEINSSSWRLISELRTFPLEGVAPLLLGGLLTAVPIGFVAWYPSRTLLGLEPVAAAAFVTPLVSLVFGAIGLWVFRRGLAHYAHTGSQRYLSYGHRR